MDKKAIDEELMREISATRAAESVWAHYCDRALANGQINTTFMVPWDNLDECERQVLTEAVGLFLDDFSVELIKVLTERFNITAKAGSQ